MRSHSQPTERTTDWKIAGARTLRATMFIVIAAANGCWSAANAQDNLRTNTPLPSPANESEVASKVDTEVASSVEAKVTRVVLFNSGVAQVTHTAAVAQRQSLSLTVSTDAVDDVLKSLVYDDARGTLAAVRYQPLPSDPEMAVAEFTTPMTVAQLLQHHRGHSITIHRGETKLSGVIVGVETRDRDDRTLEFLSLLNDDGLVSVSLEDVERFRFDDSTLRERFINAMTHVGSLPDVGTETLTLVCDGKADRDVRFAYVVDAPVWKMTYRLDLGEDQGKLQGWAHVDHVGSQPWDNVQLELRSGRPKIFRVNAFWPLLAQRRDLGISPFGFNGDLTYHDQGLMDLVQGTVQPESWSNTGGGGGGFGGGGGGGFGGGGGGFGGGGLGGGGGGRDGGRGRERDEPLDITRGFSAGASLGKAAQVVRITVQRPVSLAAKQSAMIPVFEQTLPTKLETWFTAAPEEADDSSVDSNSSLVAKFTNQTKTPLLAGPIAIYRDGNFLGDAVLKRTEIGDEAVLSYGTDQPLSLKISDHDIDTRNDQIQLVFDGRLMVSGARTRTFELSIQNQDTDDRMVTVVIEISDPKVQSDPKPVETTQDTLHFEFSVPASTTFQKTITLTSPLAHWYRLRSLSRMQVLTWQDSIKNISKDARLAMEKYLDVDQKLSVIREQHAKALGQIKGLKEDQERRVRMLAAISSKADSHTSLVDKVLQVEDQLDTLSAEATSLHTQIQKLEAELK